MFPCSQQLHEYTTVNIIVVYLFIKDQHNMVNGPLYQQILGVAFSKFMKSVGVAFSQDECGLIQFLFYQNLFIW